MAINEATSEAMLEHQRETGHYEFYAELVHEEESEVVWKEVYRCKQCNHVVEQERPEKERKESRQWRKSA